MIQFGKYVAVIYYQVKSQIMHAVGEWHIKQKICCDANLQNKESNNACCGRGTFETTWKICCDNVSKQRVK
jgi:hypothetical protein